MMQNTLTLSLIAREATSYPFYRPQYPFLFFNGHVKRLDFSSIQDLNSQLSSFGCSSLNNLTPVLAYGANASPERLALKFCKMFPSVIIPVIPAQLYNFDIVYACHFSSYGAIPSTIQVSQGTICNIAVTWLSDRLLNRMTETEVGNNNYTFGMLRKVKLDIEGIGNVQEIWSYWTKKGCLSLLGSEIALSLIEAKKRKFPAMNSLSIANKVRQSLAPKDNLDVFIKQIVSNPTIREKRSIELAKSSVPFLWSN